MSKIIAVILAAAGGFVAGILLAPKSGKETREDLMDKTVEYKGKAQESLEVIKTGAASIKEELKASGKAVKETAAETAEEVKRTAR